MQLHHLRLTAIGPFTDPVEIDLDRVSASGIFLLEGPTGAGKSTLIDAIVFALYGDVAARASSTDRMTSALTPVNSTPSVELTFSTGRGVYRIRRTPRHERRKRRGTGTVTEPAKAMLWRLVSPDSAESAEPVSTRIDEIGAEVVDIVGLSREQFVQTVVLPQGEFATFLRADAEHRRALLQRLFGTEVYDHTVERLVELRRRARQQRDDAALASLGAVRAYCGASGRGGDEEEQLVALFTSDPDQLLVTLQQQLDDLTASSAAAGQCLTMADVIHREVRAELGAAERREQARLRAIELRAALAALDEGAEQLTADTERLDAAERAARVVPSVTGLVDAERRVAALRDVLDTKRQALSHPEAPRDAWADGERSVIAQLGELEATLDVEAQVLQVRATLTEQRARHDRLLARRTTVQSAQGSLPQRIDRLRGQLVAATSARATLPAARERSEAARQLVVAGRALDEAVQTLTQAVHARDLARQATQAALAEAADLRSRFIDGIAGHLAAELQPDAPCPVCGSVAHPAPAARSSDGVDRVEVAAAEERSAEQTRRVEQAAAEVASLQSRVAELRGAIGGVATTELLGQLAEAEEGVAAAAAADAEAVSIAATLAEHEQQLADHRTELEQLDTALARLDADMAATDAALADKQSAVAEAASGFDSIAARVAALRVQQAQWHDAVQAGRDVDAATSDVTNRRGEVERALAASPFSGRAQVLAAHLDEDHREALRHSIDERRSRRAECEAQLRSEELRGVEPGERGVEVSEVIDVETIGERVRAAEADLAHAQDAAARLAQRLGESRARAAEVQTALAAQRTVARETEPTIRMADLASASTQDNAKAMSLPTFVVRERFVEVVASANCRLAAMSGGRYRLEHVESRRGNRKSGLELQVRDSHMEQPRDPATLSGGETFYCSLALALGLADVVTAEAGGVDLGTLFVDEGFGSLDPETLDQVLEVLQGLARSGRAVGIVSHVPELKEQITERISVIPNRDGSSRLVVAA